MKSKDIAKNYGVDHAKFVEWIKHTDYLFKTSMMGGLDVPDEQEISRIVSEFKVSETAESERLENEKANSERTAREKQVALSSLLITTGFSFEGYAITKYSGYISGDDAVQVDRGTAGIFARATDVGTSLMSALADIRENALAELKEAAHSLGCNAVIGVDFDYITLDPEPASSSGGVMYLPYVFGVTANGTAVVVERNDL